MKVQDSRHVKRERLRSGVEHVRAGKIALANIRAELGPFFQKEHRLCRLLAGRYAESTFTIVEGFPEGDAPEDVVESHVDALCFHDEAYAKRLFSTDDLVVRVLRGTCTVTRRFYQWLDAGDLFTLGGRQFRVTAVTRERVGEVDEPEAKREGARSLAEWRRFFCENLPQSVGAPEWNPETIAVRHEFIATDLAR
jgi:N4-acetylcytidine amidohydrolase